jgi:hypothetical protein
MRDAQRCESEWRKAYKALAKAERECNEQAPYDYDLPLPVRSRSVPDHIAQLVDPPDVDDIARVADDLELR